MIDDDDAPRVTLDPSAERYDISLDGHLVGFAAYSRQGDVVVFDHTVIDPAHRGRGLAGILVEAAVADVAARGERFAPACSFVARWLETHHEYDAFLADPA